MDNAPISAWPNKKQGEQLRSTLYTLNAYILNTYFIKTTERGLTLLLPLRNSAPWTNPRLHGEDEEGKGVFYVGASCWRPQPVFTRRCHNWLCARCVSLTDCHLCPAARPTCSPRETAPRCFSLPQLLTERASSFHCSTPTPPHPNPKASILSSSLEVNGGG